MFVFSVCVVYLIIIFGDGDLFNAASRPCNLGQDPNLQSHTLTGAAPHTTQATAPNTQAWRTQRKFPSSPSTSASNLDSRSPTSLKFAHVNLNSIMNKVGFVQDTLLEHDIDILGVSESWLTSSTPDSFVSIPGYSILRSDSPSNTKKHGVCTYIKSSMEFVPTSNPIPNLLSFFSITHQIHVLCLYRPPSNSPNDDANLLEFITRYCSDKDCILIRDFNLPSISWSHPNESRPTPHDQDFLDTFEELNLTQWVKEPTFTSGSTLDLILTSDDSAVLDCWTLPPLPQCQHSVVLCSYLCNPLRPTNSSLKRRDWFRGNYGAIKRFLSTIDWEHEFRHLSYPEKYERFSTILTSIINLHIPLRRESCSPRWRHRPPRNLSNRRSALWLSYKNMRSEYSRNSNEAKTALAQY